MSAVKPFQTVHKARSGSCGENGLICAYLDACRRVGSLCSLACLADSLPCLQVPGAAANRLIVCSKPNVLYGKTIPFHFYDIIVFLFGPVSLSFASPKAHTDVKGGCCSRCSVKDCFSKAPFDALIEVVKGCFHCQRTELYLQKTVTFYANGLRLGPCWHCLAKLVRVRLRESAGEIDDWKWLCGAWVYEWQR